jgi:hypothetical protein
MPGDATPHRVRVMSMPGDATRNASSMFTLRGEVRYPTDLLVAEVVIDSKLYPEGYQIKLASSMWKNHKHVILPSPAVNGVVGENVLPLVATLHTMPSSPLHSSGLNSDRPPRHLLRLTLPTAQYQSSTTLQDPLTGEIRSPPQKPQWFVDMQDEGGAVVDIEVVPARATSGSVDVNGVAVTIVGEKESLTNLGRDELQDDRVSKADVLSRYFLLISCLTLADIFVGVLGRRSYRASFRNRLLSQKICLSRLHLPHWDLPTERRRRHLWKQK